VLKNKKIGKCHIVLKKTWCNKVANVFYVMKHRGITTGYKAHIGYTRNYGVK
jgi:hypothetical protein